MGESDSYADATARPDRRHRHPPTDAELATSSWHSNSAVPPRRKPRGHARPRGAMRFNDRRRGSCGRQRRRCRLLGTADALPHSAITPSPISLSIAGPGTGPRPVHARLAQPLAHSRESSARHRAARLHQCREAVPADWRKRERAAPSGTRVPVRSRLTASRRCRSRPLYGRSSHQLRMFTARATTRPRMISEINACTPMVILAQCRSGMTSVGLKAVAFVRPR